MKFFLYLGLFIQGILLVGCHSMTKAPSSSHSDSTRDPSSLNQKTYFAKEIIENFSECTIEKARAGNEYAVVVAQRSRVELVGRDDRTYPVQALYSASYKPNAGKIKKTSETVSFAFDSQGEYSPLEVCKAFVADLKNAVAKP